MAYGDRKKERVDFERGIDVYLMGSAGTWRRDCLMIDVSQTGARLCIEGSFEGLDLREFFLLFFQAEDGIRDTSVTGVQTCALPIYRRAPTPTSGPSTGTAPRTARS